MKLLIVLFVIVCLAIPINSGPIAAALCSSGCAALVVACYAAAGVVFGTITAGLGTPPAILACNAAFGTCMASCAAALVIPVP